jgi:RNA polymerase sigma-70 factor (ECF subfamily)
MKGLSDPELVRATLAGSQEAFRELVARFERPVFGLIVRMVGDAETAEDLAQEVFVKAYRALATYDPARKLASWLFKIAHNATIDHLRRSVPESVPLEGDDEGRDLLATLSDAAAESPAAAAERRAMARALERAIRGLRPDYREAVVLRYVEGQSYEEIAEALAQPLGTVKTNLHRARKQMAVALSAQGWGPAAPAAETAETGKPSTS